MLNHPSSWWRIGYKRFWMFLDLFFLLGLQDRLKFWKIIFPSVKIHLKKQKGLRAFLVGCFVGWLIEVLKALNVSEVPKFGMS